MIDTITLGPSNAYAMPKSGVGNFNFSLPPVLAEEFRRIGDVQGERNKLRWSVAAAAVLKLLELPEEEMFDLIQRVAGARNIPGRLEKMVEEAKVTSAEAAKSLALAKKGTVHFKPLPPQKEGSKGAAGKSPARSA